MKILAYSVVGLAVLLAVAVVWREKHPPTGAAKLPAALTAKAPVPTVSTSPAVFPAEDSSSRMRLVTDRTVTMLPAGHGPAPGSPVRLIIDSQFTYEQRMKAIDQFSGSLTEEDWKLLKNFLTTADSLDREQHQQVIKNRLLDYLCAVEPPPDGLGKVLAQMYRNGDQADVIRDYAVQHMAAYYEQMEGQPDSTRLLQANVNVLWEAAKETGDSIGGTALLGLERLAQEGAANVDRAKVQTAAVQMAGDFNSGELSRITAFQVCAQTGAVEALPVIVQAAQNGETIPVRMSAIGALGSLGGTDQIPFLREVAGGEDERLRPVAQRAVEQILNRQEQASSQK